MQRFEKFSRTYSNQNKINEISWIISQWNFIENLSNHISLSISNRFRKYNCKSSRNNFGLLMSLLLEFSALTKSENCQECLRFYFEFSRIDGKFCPVFKDLMDWMLSNQFFLICTDLLKVFFLWNACSFSKREFVGNKWHINSSLKQKHLNKF